MDSKKLYSVSTSTFMYGELRRKRNVTKKQQYPIAGVKKKPYLCTCERKAAPTAKATHGKAAARTLLKGHEDGSQRAQGLASSSASIGLTDEREKKEWRLI